MPLERPRLFASLGDNLEGLLVGSAETSAGYHSSAPPLAQFCLPCSLRALSPESAPQQTLAFTSVSGEPHPTHVAWLRRDSLSCMKCFGPLWLCDQPPPNPVAKNNHFAFVFLFCVCVCEVFTFCEAAMN